ncbi:anthranilate phosphoribosyltransferase [Vagococcus acidifermentans]|uniref:Anthranilate phosphoribosyltransferase n=1 Tax=Vagococcus acidifermentans TaxID=564710 RepID=A0A430AM61_9ENTE|nr:anthranilate phosphoribosyltransferase [Vagococcus acidifermentans]RSU09240.1 anthranilate phosphoribosyltransferase [Vagococcus acidifermentans]
MQQIYNRLYNGSHLDFQQMTEFAQNIVSGNVSESQLGAALVAMKFNGVSAEELAALAAVMQHHALPIAYNTCDAMDNCGTGGDYSNSFNISTAAAFVLAAGGITMAKHGNRGISSRSGSADVLEYLGVDIRASADKITALLDQLGIAFLFAPALHPVMRAVMKIRKELATPTVFNLLGPLINPVPLKTQLMGTYAKDSMVETAGALGKLGRKRALVIHGHNGMDEANLAGNTTCALFTQGKVEKFTVDPAFYGFERAPIEAITGGDARHNAAILLDVLANKPSVYLDTVILNAGLGFFANGKTKDISAGIELARMCVASGAAYDKLFALIQYN